MAMDEATTLASSKRSAMVAAAGCGKTEVIAAAVAQCVGPRELILTHTHAGVEAIRRRLRKFDAPAKSYEVDTIAGWALGLARAFPQTSGLSNDQPRSNTEYSDVYAAAARLLSLPPIHEVMRASYSGVFVDEYQDCTLQQHELVVALRDVLPCRILGDPLQGIFNFGDNVSIRWDEHVVPSFDDLAGPTKPWRWANSNLALGVWLQDVRTRLEQGQEIDLHNAPVEWVDGSDPQTKLKKQISACYRAANHSGESVIVVRQWPNQCHEIASRLGGRFSCVEAIDTKDLYEYATRFDESTGCDRAVAVIDFAGKCMTKALTELKTIRSGLEQNRFPKVQKHADCLDALRAVSESRSLAPIDAALYRISKISGTVIYRWELIREMARSINAVKFGEADTLANAAWIVRNRARQRGRQLPRCAVGTTLLVKGLEFDHAVVLDADAHNRENLYVALTRGSKSLTIVSKSQIIRPAGSS